MSVTAARGWRASGVRAGIKPSGAPDVALVCSERPASVAGAFTTNAVLGAPVIVSKPRVASGNARGVVVSSGIANVATGRRGIEDAVAMAAAAAIGCGVPEDEMLVSSTGLIGAPLPMDLVLAGIDAAASALSADGDEDAALAICTTDAFTKTATRRIEVGGGSVTVGGMAKGAGMIAPSMEVLHATLLCFVTTDAVSDAADLRDALGVTLPSTFNSITVDGCTSTSDTVLLFANGASGVPCGGDAAFVDAVRGVLADLAYEVVRDGEGASRVIRTRVVGAATERDARTVAREVASSLLVRCAVAGGDPNWGRIAQAAGQADAAVDPDRLAITVCGVPLASAGADTGREQEAAAALSGAPEALVEVSLGLGDGAWEYLSSDLTPDYVRFNAEYTT